MTAKNKKDWTLEVWNQDKVTAQEFANDLRLVADSIEQGYTSGVTGENAWNLKEAQ